jgi:hypothetical protein
LTRIARKTGRYFLSGVARFLGTSGNTLYFPVEK